MTAWGKVAMLAVVGQGVVFALLDPTAGLGAGRSLALACCALLYLTLACWDGARARLGMRVYLVVQNVLGLLLPWLGAARPAMSPLAIVSQNRLVLSTPRTLLLALLHTVNVVAACYALLPHPNSHQALSVFGVALVFTLAFTQAVANELRAIEALQAASLQLQAQALQAEELATARERSRIAHEVHDSIGHTLTTAHVHMQLTERQLKAHPEQAEQALQALITAQRVVREGLADLRASVRALQSPSFETGDLEAALERLVADRNAAELTASFAIVGEPRELPEHVMLAIYRVAQEATTNVVKHAHASRLFVELRFEPEHVTLIVGDNGTAAANDAAANTFREGLGLSGIRQRAERLGGTLQLTRQQGLVLTWTIPT